MMFVAGFAVLAAACGGGGQTVGTVEGIEISVAQVEELSANQGAVSQEQFIQDLRNTIVEVAVIKAAEDQFGIAFTEDEIDAKRDELQAQIEAEVGDYEAFLESRGFTDARIRRIGHQQLVAEAVERMLLEDAGPITEEQIETEYQAQLPNRTIACLSHLLVDTEEEASDARTRIVEGEDFNDVASDVSTDPSAAENDGDLGCGPLGQFVSGFARGALEAEIGVVTEPVRSEFGYHLILVESRESETLDEARDEIRQILERTRGQVLFQEWIVDVVVSADVQIQPEYGQWVTEPSPQVLPPQ